MSYARSVQKYSMNIWQEPGLPRILIEGDSWAEHPLVANLSWSLHLRLRNLVHILNISESGDLIFNMAHGKQFKKLRAFLESSRFDFDMLLLSGGGNDILVNDQPEFQLSNILKAGKGKAPESYIKADTWKLSLERIVESYRIILDMAKEVNPNLLIHAHNYDYIYPRNRGADVIVIPDVLGPWVFPVMQDLKITDQEIQKRITDYMLEQFNQALASLAEEYAQFDYSHTLGTLPSHTSWGLNLPNWDDEIHPNSKGFARLVEAKLAPDILRRLEISG